MIDQDELLDLKRSLEELRETFGHEREALLSRVRQLTLRLDAEQEARENLARDRHADVRRIMDLLQLHTDRLCKQSLVLRPLILRFFPKMVEDFEAVERVIGKEADDLE